MLRTLALCAAAATLAAADDVLAEAEKAAQNLVRGYKPSCENPYADGKDDVALCATQHAALTDWLEAGGATLNPAVEIGYAASGRRGLFATEPFSKGTELASIPRSLWLDEAVAMESAAGELLGAVKEQAKGMPAHIPTLLWLVHEKLLGEQSTFEPFFQVRHFSPLLLDLDLDLTLP